MSTPYDAVHGIRPHKIWEGALARAVSGDRIQLAFVDLEPNVEVPTHQHESEQVGTVLKGVITMTIGEAVRTLSPGETYVIASNLPHKAVAGPEGCAVIDVFSPPRADWESLERLEPSTGRWP
ncbi:MAG TPA: cupin domain-containing protein [Candidatus Dormibacteraeota bacterium]